MADVDLDLYEEIKSGDDLTNGDVVRRVNPDKDQQGTYRERSEDGEGLVVTDVINIRDNEFVSAAGILRPTATDKLYKLKQHFTDSEESQQALEILRSWSLFQNTPALQEEMTTFVKSVFGPKQVLKWKKNDELKNLFVPIQQKLKVGRFQEKIDWNKRRDEIFYEAISKMQSGKHMTYVAFIPREGIAKPMFYTYGTKPHLETMKELERQPFAFKPTHGGHIKCISSEEGEPKKFLLDAGSNDLGVGVQTPLSTAEMIVDAFHDIYGEDEALELTPVRGRDAFGIQQSY